MSLESIGRYTILKTLGQGAMGTVYLAEDPRIERKVAIKVIRPDTASSLAPEQKSEIEARFLREAKLAGRLTHPNIVAVYDVGTQDGFPWMAMEFIEGISLGDRMRQVGHPMTLLEKVMVVRAVADALAHAHARGVIHRDIKPANVMVSKAGEVKVADFGIGKRLGESTEMTRTGMMVGSPSYMSPEQIRGDKVDSRSDLFSLGVVFYELVTGARPFPADTITTLVYQILSVEPPDPTDLRKDLPKEVGAILRRALAKNPGERYQEATELVRDLSELAAVLDRRTQMPTLIGPLVTGGGYTGDSGTHPTVLTNSPAAGMPMPAPAMRSSAAGMGGSAAPVASAPGVPSLLGGASEEPPPPGRSKGPLFAAAAIVLAALGGGAWWVMQGSAPSGGELPAGSAVAGPDAATGSAAPLEPVAPAGTATVDPVTGEVVAAPATGSVTAAPAATAAGRPPRSAAPAPPPSPNSAPPVGQASDVARAEPSPAPPAAHPEPPRESTPRDDGREPSDVYHASEKFKLNADPEQARVFLDGRPIGISDDWDGFGGGAYLVVPAGRHRLRFSLPGHEDEVVDIVLDRNADEDQMDIEPKLMKVGSSESYEKKGRPAGKTRGPVRFQVTPPTARVTVDGQDQGTAADWSSNALVLRGAPRVAEIVLTAPSGKKKTIRVVVVGDGPDEAKIKESFD